MRYLVLGIGGLAALTVICSAGPDGSRPKPVDFDREIRPILSDRCYACHGPDEKHRMANLRLDVKDGGIYSRLTPGDALKSRLFQRIAPDAAGAHVSRMPPSGPPLTDQQIALVRRWIEEGAKWEVHWAYVAPQRPPLPDVKDKAWVRNPIDRFVLARLEHEGLQPSPQADKATLLRRLSFDLTGLPPSPAEIDAFLKDRSPAAYEKQVDRLLGSARYGERMTMQWLDLARYADTHGYHIDSHRDMWHWRDWVIGAFNRNMPYDEFIVEQLAGDLLPHATVDQKIATGFNRNHMINFEGGAIPEEYQNEYVVDRVETTATAFLGMTLGCARCHDHKYDPISQKDFYRFYAFFNTIPEKGLDGRRGNAEPVLEIKTPEQARDQERIAKELDAARHALANPEVAALQTAWETGALDHLPPPSRRGLLAHYEFDGNLVDSSGGYARGRTLHGDAGFGAGVVDKAAEFGLDSHVDFGPVRDFDPSRPFSMTVWVRSNGILESDVLESLSDPATRSGFELHFGEAIPIGDLRRGAQLSFRLTHRWPDDGLEIRTRDHLPQSSKDPNASRPWYHVAITYDGSGKASGLKMWLDGEPAATDVLKDHLDGRPAGGGRLEIGNTELAKPYKGQLDDLRFYNRVLDDVEIRELAQDEPSRASLLLLVKDRSRDQKNRLRDYFLSHAAPENYRKLHADLQRLEVERRELQEAIPTTMVMEEMEKPRETVVLGRGDYRNRGEKVTPGVPAVLPPLPAGAPLNRLTLARWLTNPAHPLTARVAVNHFWQLYFGLGLVKTAEDFGSQGEPPVEPELLDWLATEFVRTHWDVKAMQKLIVMSATYRQSSRVTPTLLEKDPENRLFARGPRFRLQAEMVRDNALAISGLLQEKTGGPSVFPYQPPGLWEETAYGDVYSAQTYKMSTGADLYRRSIYTFWKRTSAPPAMIAFDAPDREKCVARRSVTNTPLQALVLMNDPELVEAAKALAQRMQKEAGPALAARVAYGFRLATGREPSREELEILLEEARGESGLTLVATTILNLDEVITKQ